MVCRDFILPEPASYVFFYAIFNLRNLLYIIILFVCVLVLMGAGYIVLAGSLGKAACACNSQESLFILTVKIVTNGFSQM